MSTRARTASRWRKEATRILSTKRDRLSEVTYDTIAAAITKVDVLEVGRVTKDKGEDRMKLLHEIADGIREAERLLNATADYLDMFASALRILANAANDAAEGLDKIAKEKIE